jgi:hypothetical protein
MGALFVFYIRQAGDFATGQLSSRLLPHQYAEDAPGASDSWGVSTPGSWPISVYLGHKLAAQR